MRFAQPVMFHLFWVLFALGIFLWWGIARRKETLQRFAQSHLLKDLVPAALHKRWVWKNILVVAAGALSILALARPQWGFEWQEVKRHGLDILVVVDTSKSMLTSDVKPNRLERTKLAVQDLVKKLKGDRIGLIAFAGDAVMACPLTVDYGGFLLSLNDLDARTVGRGGTNLSRAIEEAVRSYDQTPNQYKAVIVITDGDDLEGDSLSAARKAKEKGIKIYSIGIGTPEGELIQFTNEKGEMEFLKDNNGNYVKSRLNENLLQQIALETGGMYVRAGGAEFGLDFIYDHELSGWERRDIDEKMQRHYYDRFQIPLAMAFFLLLIETCLNMGLKK
ncbi:MAG: VWA domain-containing protein [Candidatus Omnitrophica bacterium]|nr:VWA domain-containing protein [Candidatus Omnitrophota bacterium]